MTFQTVEQMQEKINILEGAVSALEDAISAQTMSIKILEVAAAQEERAKIVAWLRDGGADDIVETHKAYLRDLADYIEAGEHLK
jgi:hypothetical protein